LVFFWQKTVSAELEVETG